MNFEKVTVTLINYGHGHMIMTAHPPLFWYLLLTTIPLFACCMHDLTRSALYIVNCDESNNGTLLSEVQKRAFTARQGYSSSLEQGSMFSSPYYIQKV